MTPAATTPAGRVRTRKPQSTGHRAVARPRPAPKLPRRISGPIRGRATAAPAARAYPAQQAAAFVRALPDHRLLDRLVRGRVWIPMLGVMLTGIVAMQVEVLKLGASIGRSIQQGSALQSRNEQLREAVASLADDQRIERLAAGMGMVMSPPAGVSFLAPSAGANVQQAVANLHAPNSQQFLAQLAASNASTATPAVTTTSSNATLGQTAAAPTVAQTAPTSTQQPSTSTQAPQAATSSPTAPTTPVAPVNHVAAAASGTGGAAVP